MTPKFLRYGKPRKLQVITFSRRIWYLKARAFKVHMLRAYVHVLAHKELFHMVSILFCYYIFEQIYVHFKLGFRRFADYFRWELHALFFSWVNVIWLMLRFLLAIITMILLILDWINAASSVKWNDPQKTNQKQNGGKRWRFKASLFIKFAHSKMCIVFVCVRFVTLIRAVCLKSKYQFCLDWQDFKI